MDELEQFLGGATKQAAPSAPTSNNPGNLRPVGSSTGFQQFSSPEEGIAAADKNLQAYGKKGINTLRGVITRWAPPSENDTEAYINTVAKKIGLDPNQQIDLNDPVQRHVISGAMFTVEKGSKNLFKSQQTQQTQQAQPAGDELEAFLSGGKVSAQPTAQAAPSAAGAGRGSYAGYNVNEAQENAAANQPQGTAVGRTAAKVLGKVLEGRRALGEIVATPIMGAISTPLAAGAGIVEGLQSGKFGTPEGVRLAQEKAAAVQRGMMPEIRTPAGQAVLGGLQQGLEAAKVPPVVPELLGVAPLGAAASEQAKLKAIQAGQQVAEKTGQVISAAKEIPTAIGRKLGVGELEIVKPTMTKEQAAADFAARQAPAGSVGAAKAEFNPYAGQITGEETARGQFPQVKLSKTPTNVAPAEQATRSAIAQEILGEGQPVRTGVITGNENTLRTEHAKAKMPDATPEGQLLKQQIANEQTALSNYAQQRIDNTGASPTLVTPYERGERINSAFAGDEGLAGFFKQEKRGLYDEANARTGGNPIQSTNVENLFNDKQFKAGLGLKGNEGVARSAEELINLAKNVGFKDDMGNVYAPNTVGAWTAVQKSLNSNWTPQNASIIRKINQAIERDIGAAGGLDLLKKADQLHQAEKVLFGSKGIKQIFGDIDPNGVQTATAFEAIPQKLNSMPLDQWKHIYETAEKVAKGTIDGPIDKATGLPKWSIQVPEELRVSAQSAMNEMRGNIAREVYQAGAAKAGEWNQNAVNKILNARADKIKLAFSPEEQKAFHTLNVGGYLMPGVHGYEGAGLQGRRVQGIIEGNLGKMGAGAGATVGGAIAGAPGAAVGGYLGGQAGLKAAGRMEARALQKAAEKTQREMQKNAQMGKNNANDLLRAGKK